MADAVNSYYTTTTTVATRTNAYRLQYDISWYMYLRRDFGQYDGLNLIDIEVRASDLNVLLESNFGIALFNYPLRHNLRVHCEQTRNSVSNPR